MDEIFGTVLILHAGQSEAIDKREQVYYILPFMVRNVLLYMVVYFKGQCLIGAVINIFPMLLQ